MSCFCLRHTGIWGSRVIAPPIPTSALVVGGWSTVCLGKEPPVTIDRNVGGSQRLSGRCRVEKNL